MAHGLWRAVWLPGTKAPIFKIYKPRLQEFRGLAKAVEFINRYAGAEEYRAEALALASFDLNKQFYENEVVHTS